MNRLYNMATFNEPLSPKIQRLQKAGLVIFTCALMLSHSRITSAADTQGNAENKPTEQITQTRTLTKKHKKKKRLL